ncbi:hypothetical protein PENTCL1PPCAC_16151, partial [Pristionchus entomophagus]
QNHQRAMERAKQAAKEAGEAIFDNDDRDFEEPIDGFGMAGFERAGDAVTTAAHELAEYFSNKKREEQLAKDCAGQAGSDPAHSTPDKMNEGLGKAM